MKITRSFPANSVARANVPTSTMTLNTLTLQKYSTCIRIENTAKHASRSSPVLSCTHAFASSVMKERSFTPLMSMKYTIAVRATPPNMPIFHLRFFLNPNENRSLVRYCIRKPNTKAIATETKIAIITESAFSVFM